MQAIRSIRPRLAFTLAFVALLTAVGGAASLVGRQRGALRHLQAEHRPHTLDLEVVRVEAGHDHPAW